MKLLPKFWSNLNFNRTELFAGQKGLKNFWYYKKSESVLFNSIYILYLYGPICWKLIPFKWNYFQNFGQIWILVDENFWGSKSVKEILQPRKAHSILFNLIYILYLFGSMSWTFFHFNEITSNFLSVYYKYQWLNINLNFSGTTGPILMKFKL